VESYCAYNDTSGLRLYTFSSLLYRAAKWETSSRSSADTFSTCHCLKFPIMILWLVKPLKPEVHTRILNKSVPASLPTHYSSITEFYRLILLRIIMTAYCKKPKKQVGLSHFWAQCRNKFWGPACPLYKQMCWSVTKQALKSVVFWVITRRRVVIIPHDAL
jgi:hypothetical protein